MSMSIYHEDSTASYLKYSRYSKKKKIKKFFIHVVDVYSDHIIHVHMSKIYDK